MHEAKRCRLATVVDDLPDVAVSTDPYDNFLLAMAFAQVPGAPAPTPAAWACWSA
jgi:hypothetical protein